jgi:hypothetical protein
LTYLPPPLLPPVLLRRFIVALSSDVRSLKVLPHPKDKQIMRQSTCRNNQNIFGAGAKKNSTRKQCKLPPPGRYRCSMTSLSSGGCWRVAPCPEEMARPPPQSPGRGSRQTKHFRSRGEAKTAQKSMHLPPPGRYRFSMTSLSGGGCWEVCLCLEEMARAPSHPPGGGGERTAEEELP